jgi:cytochrome c biogenesis protein CcmG/thiol:disulfide interchange protein DsbE
VSEVTPGSEEQANGPSVEAEGARSTAPAETATGGPVPGSSGPTPRPTFTHRPARHGVIGPFGGAQLVVGALVVVAVAVALVVLTTPLGTTNGTVPIDPRPTLYLIGQPTEGLHPGDLAPELSVTRADGSTDDLQDLSGKPVTLAALRGHGVWINFWATWCPPCQAETPVLRDTYAAYAGRGLDIVAISVQESSPSDVQAYAQRYGLDYTIGFDAAGDIFRKYRVYALPTQLFVDPNGVIRAVVQGPLDPTTAAYYVEQILPGSAASGSGVSGSPASGSGASGSGVSASPASGAPASGSAAPSGPSSP